MVRQFAVAFLVTSDLHPLVDLSVLPAQNALSTELAVIRNVLTHALARVALERSVKLETTVRFAHAHHVTQEILSLDANLSLTNPLRSQATLVSLHLVVLMPNVVLLETALRAHACLVTSVLHQTVDLSASVTLSAPATKLVSIRNVATHAQAFVVLMQSVGLSATLLCVSVLPALMEIHSLDANQFEHQ